MFKKFVSLLLVISITISLLNISIVLADNIINEIEVVDNELSEQVTSPTSMPIEEILAEESLASTEVPADNEESNNSSYDLVLRPDGKYFAYNITSRDVEVYVTDGQNPIAGAEVTLGSQTQITNGDGVAYFPHISTSDKMYAIVINHEDFGNKNGKLKLSDSANLPDGETELSTYHYVLR